jgi:hypothetical protein
MSDQRLCHVYGVCCKYPLVPDMFDQTKTTGKFREKPLMFLLLFFLTNILAKDLQT